MSTQDFQLAEQICQIFLRRQLAEDLNLTRESIEAQVKDTCTKNGFHLDELQQEALVRSLESQFQTVIGREMELLGDDEDWDPWLANRSAKISWHHFDRYKQYLAGHSFAPSVLARLDESTDKVLNLIGDPGRDGVWDRRGLVVGLVQSGKTAHYVGVLNKAIDAGYKDGRKHEGPICPEGALLGKPDSATGSVSRPSRPWRSRWAVIAV